MKEHELAPQHHLERRRHGLRLSSWPCHRMYLLSSLCEWKHIHIICSAEKGKYAHKLVEQKIPQSCHQGTELEENHVCKCTVSYKNWEANIIAFPKQGFRPLPKVMVIWEPTCLGLFLVEFKGQREKLLKINFTTITNYQLGTIRNFYSSTISSQSLKVK